MPVFPQLALNDLVNLVGSKPKLRAKNARVIAVQRRKNQKRFAYIVKAFEPYSAEDGHLVSFMYPNLPTPEQAKAWGKTSAMTPLKRRVKCFCTCPAFHYWGSQYLATQNAYNSGKAETRAADVRDPQQENYLCKHLVRVAQNLKGQTFTGLFDEFHIGAKTAASHVADLQPILRGYLSHHALLSDASIDVLADGLDDNTVEDVLEAHGLLVTDDLSGTPTAALTANRTASFQCLAVRRGN